MNQTTKAIVVQLLLSSLLTAETVWKRHVIDDSSVGADGVRLADFNRDGKLDIVTGWEQGGVVRVYLQPAKKEHIRERWPAVTVGQAPSVEDAVAVDLDSDGQLDVVSSCEGKTQTIYVHWSPSPSQLLEPSRWTTEAIPGSVRKQQWMFCLPMQIDGELGIDLVVGSKGPNAAVGWWQSPTDPKRLSDWKYHRIMDAGWIMSLIPMDVDQDGDADILLSDRRGKTRGVKWLDTPARDFTRPSAWKSYLIGAADKEVMFLNTGDLDQDGRKEIVATTWNQSLEIFRRSPADSVQWINTRTPLPFGLPHSKSVVLADFDRDGKMDMVTTNRSQPLDGPAIALMRFQDHPFTDTWTAADIGGPDGSKFDLIEAIDLDADGDLDLITCEEVANLGVIWYENPTLNSLDEP